MKSNNKSAKALTNAQLAQVDTSKHANPVQFVREFAIKNHKELGRSGCVRALVTKHGIAYHTARTQYQRVHALGYKLPKVAGKVAPKVVKKSKPKAPKVVAPVAVAKAA